MTERPGWFDRFATWVSGVVSRAPFFTICAAGVIGWAIGLPIFGWKNDLYHLLLNSPTTAITFLLVALLENSTARADKAAQRKLDAIAEGVADVLDSLPEGVGDEHAHELRRAVGLEERVSA